MWDFFFEVWCVKVEKNWEFRIMANESKRFVSAVGMVKVLHGKKVASMDE